MKSHFPGFYPFSYEELSSFLKTSTIVLDASVLLVLFKINTFESFLEILSHDRIKERLWLPYNIAWFYHQNMNSVILKQIENIKSSSSYLRLCKRSFQSISHYPYLSYEAKSEFDLIVNKIESENAEQIEALSNSLVNNSLRSKIDELYNGKIGESYNEAEMLEIFENGRKRFSSNIPPGFNQEFSENSQVLYHDLIIWKQMQKFAIEKDKNIVFVTNQIRDDWFYIVNTRIISPRQELINEFKQETNRSFYCISAYDFVQKACQIFEINIPENNMLSQQLEETALFQSVSLNQITNLPNET